VFVVVHEIKACVKECSWKALFATLHALLALMLFL
jgi:hypothetical protein